MGRIGDKDVMGARASVRVPFSVSLFMEQRTTVVFLLYFELLEHFLWECIRGR